MGAVPVVIFICARGRLILLIVLVSMRRLRIALGVAIPVIIIWFLVSALSILIWALPVRISIIVHRWRCCGSWAITIAILRMFIVPLIFLVMTPLTSSTLLPLPLIIPAIVRIGLLDKSRARLVLLAVLIAGHSEKEGASGQLLV